MVTGALSHSRGLNCTRWATSCGRRAASRTKLAKARGDPSLADRTEAAFTISAECPKEVLHRDSDGYTVLMEMVRNYDWPRRTGPRPRTRRRRHPFGRRRRCTRVRWNRKKTASSCSKRADRTIKSNQGGTASDTARNNGHAFLAELIDNYRPKPGSVAAVAQARRDAEAKRRAAALGLVNGGRCAQCAADCVVS